MENIERFEQWSDEKILSTCVRYGEEARTWKNKFLGLLPEVERRRLYEQKGFASVVHFAQVIGGVSEEQVARVLSVHRKFDTTPALQHLLVSGEVSVNKLAKIASIAEPANEEFLVNQAQLVSTRTLETLARDAKHADPEFVHVNKPEHILELAEDVEEELAELQNKGIDINQELRLFLEQRKTQIEQEKEQIGNTCKETDKRYIPQATRDVLEKEHGTKCSITTCTQPSEEIHHTQRFSLVQKHDPRYMAPLCKPHHQMAHSKDVRVQEMRKIKLQNNSQYVHSPLL